MSKPEPIGGLSDDERKLLIEGLIALRRERGRAWNGACDVLPKQRESANLPCVSSVLMGYFA